MPILLLNAAAVLYMTGFIWTMQLLHYPLLDRVGEEAFPRYEKDHNRLFFRAAGPGILLTFATAVALLFLRPQGVPFAEAVAGVVLLAVIMISTALLQAPQHVRPGDGFDRDAYRLLVNSNPTGPPPGASTRSYASSWSGRPPDADQSERLGPVCADDI